MREPRQLQWHIESCEGGRTWIWDLRRVPKVGSLTGSSTISLLLASTTLFSPESTVPTSCSSQPLVFDTNSAPSSHAPSAKALSGVSAKAVPSILCS